uniref:Uncharacterized protein n=1 Tax=Photinus pyralis TaxID=7054 RepID=A0A1Y1MMD6_PHOPY
MDRFCGICGARRQMEFDSILETCTKCNKAPFISSYEMKSTAVLRCSVCIAYICETNRYCEICGHTVENSKRIRSDRAIKIRKQIAANRQQANRKIEETANAVHFK